MNLTQHIGVEIQVFGMVAQKNGEHILAAALPDPVPEPEYFDIMVKIYPQGFGEDYQVFLEIEDVLHTDLIKQLALLQQVFHQAEIERL